MQSPASPLHHVVPSDPTLLTTALTPVLRPLPTYQNLSLQLHPTEPSRRTQTANIIPFTHQTTTHPSHPQVLHPPPHLPAPFRPEKRLRLDPHLQSRRTEIAKAAHHLRLEGISPQTLFFPSLPPELRRDAALRAALAVSLHSLKTHQANNRKMAWATFISETDCLETLLTLHINFPTLKVSLHRPREAANGPLLHQVQWGTRIFDEKVYEVQRRGGLGNTLMLRNLPVQVGCDELEAVLRDALRVVSASSTLLRVRTALSKGGSGRNFWVVYADVEPCRVAFAHLLGRRVSFRCGKEVRLHPVVHDDSTDADENKRRLRARALGVQESRGGGRGEVIEGDCCVERLELLVRSMQSKFVVLPGADVSD